ncbi:tyrosine-protein phosphatase [Anaerotardibacter muris]|uniref:tyrosine-protein phosphatase n=1 Tax=Anaerotardibacter muris TaxID=2941505 RepID=UPI00203EC823|nr:tyrosine-protein phosphatase [Anaerotardibacter muris]
MATGSQTDQPPVTKPADGMTDYGHIELEGTQNTRDQGGMLTATGQRVRAKKLIRSDKLAGLTDHDIEVLMDELKLRTVIDLRTEVERSSSPDPIDRMPDVKFVNAPVLAGSAVGLTHEHDLKSLWEEFSKLRADPIKTMCETYPLMLLGDPAIKAFKQIFDIFLNQEDGAILWHCSEGKDRTGITSMLILYVLGVVPEAIMEDYLATNLFAREKLKRAAHDLEKFHIASKSDEALIAFVSADERYMNAAMEAVEDKYGSLATYVEQALGITPEKREALCAKYLF